MNTTLTATRVQGGWDFYDTRGLFICRRRVPPLTKQQVERQSYEIVRAMNPAYDALCKAMEGPDSERRSSDERHAM